MPTRHLVNQRFGKKMRYGSAAAGSPVQWISQFAPDISFF
jgi:hypothetical protein